MVVWLAAVVTGCRSECLQPFYADRDGDGFGDADNMVEDCTLPEAYVDLPGDCDDRDPTVHPDATEYCNGIDDDCDGTTDPDATTWNADADGDGVGTDALTFVACSPPSGFVLLEGDCDDSDPDVFPGRSAPETCDGRDEDCDGLVDENPDDGMMVFRDSDGDGYGVVFATDRQCTPGSGWSAFAGDCDDNNVFRNPDALEVCNNTDDDCDTLVDDEDPQVIGQFEWFDDNDGDQYGYGSGTWSCDSQPGTVANATDCDDTDPTAHPLAIEVCGGGDDDCNGLADEGDPALDPAALTDGWLDADADGLGDPANPIQVCELGAGTAGNAFDCDDADAEIGADLWLPDEDGDGAGAGVAVAGAACVGPPDHVNVAAPTDCDDTDPDRFPGAPDLCGDGVDADCTGIDPVCSPPLGGFLGVEDTARGVVSGALAGGGTGASLALEDLDHDGFAELLAGAAGESLVRLFAGPGPETATAWPVWREIPSLVPGDGFGASVAALRGIADDAPVAAIVGAPARDVAGAAFVLSDAVTATDADAAFTVVSGMGIGDFTGTSVVGLGDVDGTGTLRFAVGSPGYLTGAVTISTTTAGPHDLLGADALLTGPGLGDLGAALAGGVDVDGDGVNDLVASARLTPSEDGTLYVVPGDTTGTVAIDVPATSEILGRRNSRLGTALAAGGDLDGDGLPDVAATAPVDDTVALDAGTAFVFADPSGVVDAETVAWLVVDGTAGLQLGQAVALADLDGDGATDLLVTAISADVSGQDGGAVYTFLSPQEGALTTLDADLVLWGTSPDLVGAAMALGAIDADPSDDLVVGAPTSGAGAVWLVPGAP